MRRILAISLSLLLALAVAAGIWKSSGGQLNTERLLPASELQTVKLLTGSAKFALMQDPEMQALLKRKGLRVELVKSSSFEQDKALLPDLDAVWPAGANHAADWQATIPNAAIYQVMSTPLALASWRALLPVLEKNGLLQARGQHTDFLLERALPLMMDGKRWNQLQDNQVFSVNKSFLINTPDLRKSNTSALYIAMLAYLRNGNEVPANQEKALQLAKELTPLITRQGFQEATLAGPFEDYLGQGMGKAPLVLIYESQFMEAKRAQKLRDSHVLLYPQPGLLLKHVLIAKTEAGKQLGQLLAQDADAQKLAAKYGFRTNDAKIFAAANKELGLDAPELLNLAETPATAIMDSMVTNIVTTLETR